MKNPCDTCIVKVNCTRICWQKENSAALLKSAMGQTMMNGKVHPGHVTQWRKYQGLYNQCLTDVANIQMRARDAKEQ